MIFNPHAKTKPIRSKKYREFVASIPCLIHGCGGKAAPHHESFGNGTMGGKPSDIWCLPLCVDHHTASTMSRHRHPHGWKGFYWEHNIDPAIECLRLIEMFFSQGGKL